jgi:hypothetical protein
MTTQPPLDEEALAEAGPAEIHSALFAQLVTGHAQMALTFLGRLPNPQTGEADEVNAEAAKVFIDQLEMIEAKTKGNLSAEESRMLKEMLNLSRMAFVEVIDNRPEPGVAASTAGTPAAVEDGAPKAKFSKKY